MRKQVCLLFVFLLCACQPTVKSDMPIKAEITYLIDSTTLLKTTVDQEKEVKKIIDFFNKGNVGYQKRKDGELDFKLAFINESGEKIWIEAYPLEAMGADAKFERLLCVNNEKICTEFYAETDFYDWLNGVEGVHEEINYLKIIPEQSEVYKILKVIDSDVPDTKELTKNPDVISVLIQMIPNNSVYRKINDHQAISNNHVIENPAYDEDFQFYPFSEVEVKGRQLLSNEFSLKPIKEGEYYRSPTMKIYADIANQGFLVIHKYQQRYFDYELVTIDLVEKEDEQIITFLKAPTFITNETRQFIEKSGNLTVEKKNSSSIYDQTYDSKDEYDQVQVVMKDGKMQSVKFLSQVEKQRLKKELRIEDFTITYENDHIKSVKVDSPNVDLKAFEKMSLSYYQTMELRENEQFIDISLKDIFSSEVDVNHYLFDKQTGNNLSAEENDILLNGKLLQIIEEAMQNIEVCPYYYEDAYLIDECYVPFEIIQTPSHVAYDEVTKQPIYINENGQLAIGIIMKEKGTFKEIKEVILK